MKKKEGEREEREGEWRPALYCNPRCNFERTALTRNGLWRSAKEGYLGDLPGAPRREGGNNGVTCSMLAQGGSGKPRGGVLVEG